MLSEAAAECDGDGGDDEAVDDEDMEIMSMTDEQSDSDRKPLAPVGDATTGSMASAADELLDDSESKLE